MSLNIYFTIKFTLFILVGLSHYIQLVWFSVPLTPVPKPGCRGSPRLSGLSPFGLNASSLSLVSFQQNFDSDVCIHSFLWLPSSLMPRPQWKTVWWTSQFPELTHAFVTSVILQPTCLNSAQYPSREAKFYCYKEIWLYLPDHFLPWGMCELGTTLLSVFLTIVSTGIAKHLWFCLSPGHP